MSDPTFRPYPRGEREPATHVIVVASDTGGGGNSRQETKFVGPMSESEALAQMARLSQGLANRVLGLDESDTIVSISDPEVLILAESFWTGRRRHRVQVCQRRR